jgi:ATP-dependent Lhr-like helicase
MRFFVAWQNVAGADDPETPDGPVALGTIVAQLEGFEAPAAAWETEILPARVGGYDPAWLDGLCLSGRFLWARLRPGPGAEAGARRASPIRTTPIALLAREHGEWIGRLFGRCDGTADPAKIGGKSPGEPVAGANSLSDAAGRVETMLRSRGAAFFEDIVRGTGLLRSQVEDALGELVARGRATSDSFAGLRALLAPSLNRPPLSGGHRRRGSAATFGMESAGRWSLLPEAEGRAGSGARLEVPLREICLLLLRRWGVVFRRLLDREEIGVPWRDLLREYWRLEARGEIRGGRFVAGFQGEQFALPEAVGLLRSIRRQPGQGSLVSISAADPLNLTGILLPGPRVPPVPANRILLKDGAPIAVREAGEVRFIAQAPGDAALPAVGHPTPAGAAEQGAEAWRLRNALLRRRVPRGLKAWFGRSA